MIRPPPRPPPEPAVPVEYGASSKPLSYRTCEKIEAKERRSSNLPAERPAGRTRYHHAFPVPAARQGTPTISPGYVRSTYALGRPGRDFEARYPDPDQ